MRGLFITFEGMDGAGKTTQIENLRQNLIPLGKEIIQLREPGGTPLGEKLRRVLLDEPGEITPEAETLLFAAARAELVGRVICPALARGAIVLCDRFVDSNIAYQGYARAMTPERVLEANRLALRGIMPDITFFLSIESAESERRLANKNRLDRMESEGAVFKDKVRKGFKELLHMYPERIKCIDAEKPPDEIAGEIFAAVQAWIAVNWNNIGQNNGKK